MTNSERKRDRMTAQTLAIDQVLNAPQKNYSKKEAQQLLQKYGVLTKKNTVSKAYSSIVVKVEKHKDESK